MTTYYHNPNCSKSLEGLKLLQKKKIDFQIKEYLKEELTPHEIKDILTKMKIRPREIIRSKEETYTNISLDHKNLSEDQLIDIIINYPILLERPILVTDNKAVVGRPPSNLLSIID